MRWFGFVFCLSLLVVSPSVALAAPSTIEQSAQIATVSSFETQLFTLINEERTKAGMGALSVSPELILSAQRYSAYMAESNFFGHVGPDGSTLVTRDEAAGYTDWQYVAENLAAGQTSPQDVVNAWLASPSHRANIFNPNVTETGVGYVTGGAYGTYWTQEFGNRAADRSSSSGFATSRSGSLTAAEASGLWACSETGHTVVGDWLVYVQVNGGIETFGYPLSEVIDDPLGSGLKVQYFQRAVLEYHPENPVGSQIQRRLLGDILYPGAEPAVSETDVPPGTSLYFPLSSGATGLGHFVADYTRTGQAIYFKEFFDAHGGITAFGYPKEEPTLRNGIWTQRFQGAVFQYHPEFDIDGCLPGTAIPYRSFRVQLELLGNEYVQANGLTLQ